MRDIKVTREPTDWNTTCNVCGTGSDALSRVQIGVYCATLCASCLEKLANTATEHLKTIQQ